MLKNDHNLGNCRYYAHEQGDIRVPKDALHNYLVLDFLQQLFCDVWIKDFLDSHRCSVEFTLVYYGKTSLANFFIEV